MLQHIGFIMDGNRSWARANALPQLEWHKRGYDNVEQIIDACLERQIPYISFWALSDDNISERSKIEVSYLFDLLTRGILRLIYQSNTKNIKLCFVWDRTLLRSDCRDAIEKAERETMENTRMNAIFAIWYGGQEEIARAVSQLAKSGKDMRNVTREDILAQLETSIFPPPDLIVRTGGHIRHSGYFLFQSPYSEYFFSDRNWPDFTPQDIDLAITSYEWRVRKFGK